MSFHIKFCHAKRRLDQARFPVFENWNSQNIGFPTENYQADQSQQEKEHQLEVEIGSNICCIPFTKRAGEGKIYQFEHQSL